MIAVLGSVNPQGEGGRFSEVYVAGVGEGEKGIFPQCGLQ